MKVPSDKDGEGRRCGRDVIAAAAAAATLDTSGFNNRMILQPTRSSNDNDNGTDNDNARPLLFFEEPTFNPNPKPCH